MYQLQPDFMSQPAQCIKRLADNAFIPFDDANTDYAEYLKWLAEGNTSLPALDGSSSVVADQPTAS